MNGNKLWIDRIKEEINKVRVAVQESNFSPNKLIGHQEIELHMIFGIKLGENFQRKDQSDRCSRYLQPVSQDCSMPLS